MFEHERFSSIFCFHIVKSAISRRCKETFIFYEVEGLVECFFLGGGERMPKIGFKGGLGGRKIWSLRGHSKIITLKYCKDSIDNIEQFPTRIP